MYSVYIHTLPNNKVYIGITSQKPKARWDNGRGKIATAYGYKWRYDTTDVGGVTE